jgi:hypothetical protein
MTVGVRLRDHLERHQPARTRAIVDHDLLAPDFRKLLSDDAAATSVPPPD